MPGICKFKKKLLQVTEMFQFQFTLQSEHVMIFIILHTVKLTEIYGCQKGTN